MNKVIAYQSDKATVCDNKTCITVYGETAKAINIIAVIAALITALAYLAKALR